MLKLIHSKTSKSVIEIHSKTNKRVLEKPAFKKERSILAGSCTKKIQPLQPRKKIIPKLLFIRKKR